MKVRRQLILLAAIILAGPAAVRSNPETAAEPLLDALARLEQMESLVKSAKADFTRITLPLSKEEQRRLQLYFRLKGPDTGNEFPREGRREDYHSTWYRKGIKEREEQSKIARPAQTSTLVFDGKLLFSLDNRPFNPSMSVDPASTWLNRFHIQPFAMAIEFCSYAHSDLIRGASERRLIRPYEDLPGASFAILISNPRIKQYWLRFIFDDKYRLIAREVLEFRPPVVPDDKPPVPTIIERHEFLAHKPYDDGNGNTVWFPSVSILRAFAGTLPDGSLVQRESWEVRIASMEINADIPDEKFVLEPPAGTPINGLPMNRNPPPNRGPAPPPAVQPPAPTK